MTAVIARRAADPAGASLYVVHHPDRHPHHLPSARYDAIPSELRGLHADNPVNRVRRGGTQLELSARVRGLSPRSQSPGDDGLTPATSALVHGPIATAHYWE